MAQGLRHPCHAGRHSLRHSPFATGLISLLAVLLGVPSCRPPSLAALSGETMGTTYSIKLVHIPPDLSLVSLRRTVEARLETINQQMSTYRPESEISRFNRAAPDEWFSVSPALAHVVKEAMEIGNLTDGAYDITVGTLVRLWNFGPDPQWRKVPDDEAIAAARATTGYHQLEVRIHPPALNKHLARMEIDLSSIAKGYAVDVLADMLIHQGIEDFMIEIGGEVRAGGQKADGTPWRIGIERPDPDRPGIHRVVALRDRALATSGDYRNYFEENGRRYSHILDPRTGRPLQHRLASVSVMERRCSRADALATALFVMGPESGYAFASSNGLAALFIVRDDHQWISRPTKNFESLY